MAITFKRSTGPKPHIQILLDGKVCGKLLPPSYTNRLDEWVIAFYVRWAHSYALRYPPKYYATEAYARAAVPAELERVQLEHKLHFLE